MVVTVATHIVVPLQPHDDTQVLFNMLPTAYFEKVRVSA